MSQFTNPLNSSAVFRFFGTLLVIFCAFGCIADAQDQGKVVTFNAVKPILAKRCVSCHGRNEPRSGLDLSTLEGLHSGSESGPVVVAGKPEQSLLYTLAAHIEEPIMPPGKERMASSELDVIRDWIQGGLMTSSGASGGVSMALKNDAMPSPVEEVRPVRLRTAITAFDVHPDGKLVAISGIQQVAFFDATTKQPIKAFPFPEGEVFDLNFSADGSQIVVAGGKGAASGRVIVIDVATGERLYETPEEFDAVLTADYTPDGKFLAWGGPWKTVKAVHTDNFDTVVEFDGPTDWILSTALSSDGRLVAGADRFGGLRVWNMLTGKEFWNLRGHTGAVTNVTWSPDGDFLLSVGADKTCRVWNLHNGKEISKLQLELGELWAADWHSSNRIVVGGRGKAAVVLDADGNVVGQFPVADEITEVAFAPSGESIYVADASGIVSEFAIGSDKVAGQFSLPIDESFVTLELPWPSRSRPKVPATIEKPELTTGSPEDAILAALKETEAAIESTESSLQALKQSAQRLRKSLEAMQSPK